MLTSFIRYIEQKVCLRASITNDGDGKVRPFPTLNPGQKFVTPFGVVEVVKDDRAIPTAIFPDNVQTQHRKYQKAKAAEESRDVRRHTRVASKLRIRRNAINALYEKGKVNRRSVFHAYFGGDPEYLQSVVQAKKALAKNSSSETQRSYDPKEPKDSYPDRVVECMLIPNDHRAHNLDLTNKKVKRNFDQTPTKLFLQRKILNQPYDKADTVYYCPDCGRTFNHSNARKTHCALKKCIQDAKIKKGKREAFQLKIERDAEDSIKFPEKPKYIKNVKSAPPMTNTNGNPGTNGKPRKWKKKKKKESAVYPQVIIDMGFKLVTNKKPTPTNVVRKPKPPPVSNTLPSSKMKPKKQGHELDNLLENLKETLIIQKRKANDQRHGSIYAEVYSALGFKKPGKRKATKVGNNVSERKRRKRVTKPKPFPPPKPLPPAIDVGALVDEIKSGRYPSFKVFEGEHGDECVLCKNGGKMYCCEFCGNAEHFKCILTKFTIKEPEPDEDFMCHRCIGVILSRRARAEKRRLRKQVKNEQLKKEEEIIETDPSDGNEYPFMASQAREVNELVELLKDSQIRLRRSIETTRMNNIRRRVIAGVYPEAY